MHDIRQLTEDGLSYTEKYISDHTIKITLFVLKIKHCRQFSLLLQQISHTISV